MSLIKGLRKLEEGLAQADWGLIGEGYELLAGEPPENIPSGGQDWVVHELRCLLARIDGVETQMVKAPKKRGKKSRKTAEDDEGGPDGRGGPGGVGGTPTNAFVDDLTIAPEFVEDSRKNSQRVSPRVARPPVPKLKINCKRCGVQEEISANLIPKPKEGDEAPEYYCSKCCKN